MNRQPTKRPYHVVAHYGSTTEVWLWESEDLALIAAAETAAKALVQLGAKARKYDGQDMREFILRLDRREWDKALVAAQALARKINNKVFPVLEVGPAVPFTADAWNWGRRVSRMRLDIDSSVNDQ